MNLFVLDDYCDLFRDSAACDEMARRLQDSLQSDSPYAMVYKGKLVCTMLGADAIKGVIQDRLLRRLSEDPGFLEKLQSRLESDDIVD